MSLKPWREIAQPHKDVLEGTFKQSEFAADITQVATGTAPAEYQDAKQFFARTFITEGMKILLKSVAMRLTGVGGDPVIQLQTSFGGGKTHSMLAVLHLAKRTVPTSELYGVPPILDEAGITELPVAKVAVLDGINISASQPKQRGELTINTLWGELAYQLLGEEGYQLVEASDKEGTSPGKEILVNLLKKAAPCVILIDELLAFIRQLEVGKRYPAGTFDSNMSFIQALTEALKAVPNAMLLASLPESELEVGGTMGQRALASLEKYFGRLESVWKPVAANESFEIVRRRLFDNAGERALIEGISRQFSDFYRDNAAQFPTETQSNEYFERLCSSYPIHPEVFDRLYEDWSTLEKFQRTRGVLQYLAIIIHRLWNSDNKDALIMPGSLPLEDSNVSNKSTHYLPQGWEPIIEREVDGPHSIPVAIDGQNTLFGSVQAARRVTRTIFLGSAASSSSQIVRGLTKEQILLGSVQPEQSIGAYEDVLRHLQDKLHYLYSGNERYWLDTKPNLRREMESRMRHLNDRDEVIPYIKERVRRCFGNQHTFAGIHVFTPSSDVPDDYGSGPRLVVLPLEGAYSRTQTNAAFTEAESILLKRGEQPRQKQNRLIFLAPDFDYISRLKEQVRIYLAWHSIVNDIDSGTLIHDTANFNQAKNHKKTSEKSVDTLVRETWKWLISPSQEMTKDGFKLLWEAVQVQPYAPNLIKEIENKLREEEWVIYEWSPIFLRNMLNKWYFKDNTDDVSALKVWQDTCHYLYLPRLVNDSVFSATLTSGLESKDFYAYASGKDDERYLSFTFGRSAITPLDEYSLLIEHSAAQAYAAKLQAEKEAENASIVSIPSAITQPVTNEPDSTTGDQSIPAGGGDTISSQTVSKATTSFYGTVDLEPVSAKMDFANIMDEVVQLFSSKYGVDVTISVEVSAKNKQGFDEALQRAVKENCNMLKFINAEFEQS